MRIRGFADLAISRKLTLLFTLASGMALSVFASALWMYQSAAYRQALRHEMATLAETLADNSAAALAFHDAQSADETLALLRAEPRVSSACLYRNDNVRAAAYEQAPRAAVSATPGPDRLAFNEAT